MCTRFDVADKEIAKKVADLIWQMGGWSGVCFSGSKFQDGAILEVTRHYDMFAKELLELSNVKFE